MSLDPSIVLCAKDVVLLEATVAFHYAGEGHVSLDLKGYGSVYVQRDAIASILSAAFRPGDRVRIRRNGVAGNVLAVDEKSRQAWVRFGGPEAEPMTIALVELDRVDLDTPDEPEA